MKDKMLFIAPLTNYHGQGSVSNQAKKALQENFDLNIINTFTDGFTILKHIIILFKTISKCRNFHYIYFTPSRNFFSSLRDFFLLLFVRKKTFLVGHLHGSDLFNFLENKTPYHKCLFFLYKLKINKLIILSKSHSKYALGNEFKRYKIINNPLEINFSYSKKLKSQISHEIKFCTISNPIKSKGLKKCIDYISDRFSNYNWTLDVIGWTKNDYEKVYQNSSKFTNRITFHARKDGKEKYEILFNSSYFIFLSYYKSEAQPIVLFEALLSGCKIIISDFKMLKDFKKYNNVYMDYEINTKEEVFEFINKEFKNDNSLQKDLTIKNFNLKLTNAFIQR